ncbi:hypothetical protein MRB53_037325 [Persea americana]|nr:hypothetical protein MRB53_037325 [Persea americana]
MSILTAFGLTQFNATLPLDHIPPNRQVIVSHMEPFGSRLDMEVITAPRPVNPTRVTDYANGAPNVTTQYIHFILNQRTIPLGYSYAACGLRADGWCEMETFLNATATPSRFRSTTTLCFANYSSQPWGAITNGAPLALNATRSNSTMRRI